MDKLVDLSSTFLVDPGSKLNVSSVSVSVYHCAGVTRLALHPVRARFFSRARSKIKFGRLCGRAFKRRFAHRPVVGS